MHRFPSRVYDVGDEPDPRFTLANERTFLAWCRTSLALISIAVALDNVTVAMMGTIKIAVVLVLMVIGIVLPLAAWRDWAFNERAMRLGEPLPGSLAQLVLTVGLVGCAVGVLIGMVAAW